MERLFYENIQGCPPRAAGIFAAYYWHKESEHSIHAARLSRGVDTFVHYVILLRLAHFS